MSIYTPNVEDIVLGYLTSKYLDSEYTALCSKEGLGVLHQFIVDLVGTSYLSSKVFDGESSPDSYKNILEINVYVYPNPKIEIIPVSKRETFYCFLREIESYILPAFKLLESEYVNHLPKVLLSLLSKPHDMIFHSAEVFIPFA